MVGCKSFLAVSITCVLLIGIHETFGRSVKSGNGGKTPKNGSNAKAASTIDKETLIRGLEDGSLLLIDVRSKDSLIKNGKYPGSYVVPFSDAEEAFTKLSEDDFLVKYGFERPEAPGTNVVFSCRKGSSGIKVVTQLLKLGYSGIRCYEGNLKKLILSPTSQRGEDK